MEHLENAPIVEAVIYFGVVPSTGTSIDTLGTLRRNLEATYGPWEDLLSDGAKSEASASDERKQDVVGFRTLQTANTRHVSITADHIAFHKLKPYTSWDEVFPEAWKLWEAFRDETKPESVRRLAARYINHLDLPKPPKRLGEYLQRIPPVDENHLVRGYLKHLQIKDTETGLLANLVEQLSIRKDDDELRVLVVMDNDVYAEGSWKRDEDEKMRNEFARIRELKNKLFDEAITPLVKQHYKMRGAE